MSKAKKTRYRVTVSGSVTTTKSLWISATSPRAAMQEGYRQALASPRGWKVAGDFRPDDSTTPLVSACDVNGQLLMSADADSSMVRGGYFDYDGNWITEVEEGEAAE